jgi:DNA-binding transcriptional MerR regulator
MSQEQKPVSIDNAARKTGLAPQTIRRCVQVGLVNDPLTEDDLANLRRVRRLTELEVNMAGAEIIIRMRHRILALQAELAYWKQLRIERKLDDRA